MTKEQIELQKAARVAAPDDAPITERNLEREGWYFAMVGISVSLLTDGKVNVYLWESTRNHYVELKNVTRMGQLRALAEMCGAESLEQQEQE